MHTKWNHKIVLLIVTIAVSTLSAAAQQRIWSANNDTQDSIVKDKAVSRQAFPTEFKLFDLNIEPLRQRLFSIKQEEASILGRNSITNSTVISLPNADGEMELFEVYEDSNFEPDLQAQFPEIRAYSGKGITDRYATLKLSISPQGIETMVFRADKRDEFIEPFSQDHTVYAVFRGQREKGNLPWTCSTEDRHVVSDLMTQHENDNPFSSTGEVRTVRLAQSNNGEYANFFGASTACTAADKNLVLAAFNATHTRVNGVLEKDLAIHFNLIAGTTAVIYCDPATDPYTTLSAWNGQLQATLNTNIGAANYDIGHMFGASGGGGNAGCIGCVCNDANKGSGITSPADAVPMGDNFDIDYVVHEMGHQIGGNHSFSFQNEGTGVQKEVGSGITIMGYAGITSQDVAPHSIDTFHEANIAQIQANLATKTCPVTVTMTTNHPPVVAPVPNYTIPITTPFTLTGSATDPEGDPLTYQWEQNDNSTTTGNASCSSIAKLTGPNWLSFLPTSSPTRMFPRLSTVQAGLAVTPTLPGGDPICNIEALSSVTRTLNFRLTVRDNNPYVPGVKTGQTQFTDMAVTVTSTAGPFKVTFPDATGITLGANNSATVTWNVTQTDLPPISTATVKISLSTDGGATFPTVLAASTANDGSESVLLPAIAPTSTARIKVEAIGNIYFDMSDNNFNIGPGGTPSPTPTVTPGLTPTPPTTPTPTPTPTPSPAPSCIPNVWQAGPTQDPARYAFQGAVGTDNKFYVAGGGTADNATVYNQFSRYDPATNAWSNLAPLPVALDQATMGAANGKVFVAGGFTGGTTAAGVVNTLYIYDIALGTWSTGTPMPLAREAAAGAVFNGKFYVMGGDDFAAVVTTNYVYDIAATTWSTTAAALPAGRTNAAGTAANGFIYVYGGVIGAGFTADDHLLRYDPVANSWADLGTAGTTLRGNYGGISPFGTGQLLITDGATTAYLPANTTHIFTISTGLFTAGPTMAGPHAGHAQGTLTNGKVIVVDGLNNLTTTATATNTVELLASSCTTGTPTPTVTPTPGLSPTPTSNPSPTPTPPSGRTAFDFDGDHKADVSVFRPSAGQWFLNRSTAGFLGVSFGSSTDIPRAADYTGDGKTDMAFFRPSGDPNGNNWFILRSENFTFYAFPFGTNGDIPAPADFDGDGKADAAVYRPSIATWFILKSSNNAVLSIQFGLTNDVPVPADYTGDGKAEVAIYRPSLGQWWYLNSANSNVFAATFGSSTDKPTPGDFTGDGKADVAFYRPSEGSWYILRSENFTYYAFPWGVSTDKPAPADYDGDGKYDAAVFRPSDTNWYILKSSNNTVSIVPFGLSGDTPVPGQSVP